MGRANVAVAGIGLLAVMACACGRGESVPVPKPTAYPRPALYDTVYTPLEHVPVWFEANASASAEFVKKTADAMWVNVAYPTYKGVMHITFTHTADSASREAAIANRSERMALNLGDNSAEETELYSTSGYRTTVLTAQSASLMPVQFLSVGKEWVVSGAFVFDVTPTSADSVRPIVKAVSDDVVHAAKLLR